MIIAIIPAKGQSNRLPNKNMSVLNGQPMLHYTINYANTSAKVSKTYVSTEDEIIANYCLRRGVAVIRRSNDLCGETPIIDVYRHAFGQIDNGDITAIVGLQPDHPDRKLALDGVLSKFLDEELDHLFSKESEEQKNGAHYILSRAVLLGKTPKKSAYVYDDCTNVHTKEDLEQATSNLAK